MFQKKELVGTLYSLHTGRVLSTAHEKIALFLLVSGGLVFFWGERLNAVVVEPPGNLQRTSYVESPRSITLAWQDNSNNESGFLIEWSADGGTTWSEFGQAGADVTSFSGSLPGEQVLYLFRIQATDGTDVSGYSNVISVETRIQTLRIRMEMGLLGD